MQVSERRWQIEIDKPWAKWMATIFAIIGCVAMFFVPWPFRLVLVAWTAWCAYEAVMGWSAYRDLSRSSR